MRVASSMLVLAAAMALPMGARAAEADTMSVTGTITDQNACSTSIQNGGNIDYGIIPASSLHPANTTSLPAKELAVSIICTTPTYIALQIQDVRGGGSGHTRMSLGEFRPDEWFGEYEVQRIEGVTLNGAPGYMLKTHLATPEIAGDWINAYHVDPWRVGEWRSFSNQSSGAALAVSTAQFTFNIRAYVWGFDFASLSNALRIDGQFVMEMMYM